jgi:tRNA uridine 5-carboxymethylaminomethyl modification enzyme
MRQSYDIIVIGGGHAGTEAAWAAASMLHARGGRVALVTMDPARIGTMSCNPAIGGLAKGQMVREIDALGGLMALATDATGIMFKMLNTSKGAAVRGPRAQCDKYAYAAEVQRLIASRENIDVIAGTVDDILIEDHCVSGVVLPAGAGVVAAEPRTIQRNRAGDALAQPVFASKPVTGSSQPQVIRSRAVVLTTGTFMRALMHTGERKTQGGRVNEGSAVGISATLRRLGLELGRLKTGTPPRLARESIDWDALDRQIGDELPVPFSDLTVDLNIEPTGAPTPGGRSVLRSFPALQQVDCRVTHTTAAVHQLIRENLHRAPMYAGQIDAECGPRYCPSIEDKVVRFAQRESHHVFLEPESLHTNEIYCNGISTSLPEDVQQQIIHAMPGCHQARVLRWGYAVEYDMVWPHQIDSTAAVKSVPGLFLAGQINGTSGYEEAGGQGLIAGLNAARLATSQDMVRLGRDQGYIGVMMDDLVTKTPREPYRMFTSRAEHRLLLRADNADLRLTPLGRSLGTVDDRRWHAFAHRVDQLQAIRGLFDRLYVEGKSLREIARRPETTLDQIASRIEGSFHRTLIERVMTEARYDGYIVRQQADIKRQAQADARCIPDWLDVRTIEGLRAEAAETLLKFRPVTMGQASRLAGITPADLSLLAVMIKRGRDHAIANESSGDDVVGLLRW